MLPFELKKDTPYLALSGELWSVFYEYFNRNWSCYKGFLLYVQSLGLTASGLDFLFTRAKTPPDPDNKDHGANMGPIWGRQDPGGPHVGPMIFAIWGTGLNPLNWHCHEPWPN